MNTSVMIETLASCMIIPLFVLGVLVVGAVILLILDKGGLRRGIWKKRAPNSGALAQDEPGATAKLP